MVVANDKSICVNVWCVGKCSQDSASSVGICRALIRVPAIEVSKYYRICTRRSEDVFDVLQVKLLVNILI